jgi:chromate transporter
MPEVQPMINMLLLLIWSFLKIGLFGFGGGLAMLPLLFQTVQDIGVMSGAEFANLVAIAQVTPGPVIINAATYVGYNEAGILGAIISTIAISIPPFVLTCLAVHFLDKFKGNRIVESVLTGIRPVTVGLIATAIIYVGESSIFTADFTIANIAAQGLQFIAPIPLAIFAVSLLLGGKFKVNPIFIVLGSGMIGALIL